MTRFPVPPIAAAGCHNIGGHLTAVPVSQCTLKCGQIVPPNATKQSLEATCPTLCGT